MSSEKIYDYPIHTLHEKRIANEISTKQITEAVLDRRKTTEPVIKAYIHSVSDQACLENAEISDEKIRKGEEINPLDGMPIGIKDIYNIKDMPLTCASQILKGYVSPYESTVTSKLKKTGYNLTGKLNMDEFAMGSSNENSSFSPVSNPWDTERVPGGSSGGSAASVATGSALAALGTDTGGSIRQPASFTSTVGIKPTYGFCSRYGIVAFASSFDQAGPFTKDVEDAALLLKSIGGYDHQDSTSLNLPLPDFTASLKKGVEGMNIGIINNIDLTQCNPEIRENYEASVDMFRKNGNKIIPVNIEYLEHAIAVYYIIACSEASSNLGRYDGVRYGHRSAEAEKIADVYKLSRDEGFGHEVKLRILLGTFALSSGYYDAYYSKAKKIQAQYKKQFNQIFESIDFLLSPVSPVLPFKKNEKVDDPLQMYLADIFTVIVNIAGLPAMSVPSGFSKNNLPIGLQMIGGHLQEAKLLRGAYWFEKQNTFKRPPLKI